MRKDVNMTAKTEKVHEQKTVERGKKWKKRFSNVKSGWHRFNYDARVRESTTVAVTSNRIEFCCAESSKLFSIYSCHSKHVHILL